MGKIKKTVLLIVSMVSTVMANPVCTQDIMLFETTTGECPKNYYLYEFKNYEQSTNDEEWFYITTKNMCYGIKPQNVDCEDVSQQFSTDIYLTLLDKLKKSNQNFKTANNCQELIDMVDYELDSGFYTIKNNIKVYCDMEENGGGWIDVVKTLSKYPNYSSLFFLDRGIIDNPIPATNDIGEKGLYLKYGSEHSHSAAIYFYPQEIFKTKEVSMDYILQGDINNSGCTNGNWVPLNGPGFSGGNTSYQAPCPSGKSCIQGTCEYLRDKPIESKYTNNNLLENEILTWSGSKAYTGYTVNCSRSYKIPTSHVALWFKELKIR